MADRPGPDTAGRLHAAHALLHDGWARDVRITIGGDGRIAEVECGVAAAPGDAALRGRVLLPALANLHSHAFQRALAGLTEGRGPDGRDSFWTWRRAMYRFLDRLTPDQVEAIAAQVYVEMLEAGYAAVGEFHYLHHGADGTPYDDPGEMSARIAAAAGSAGIGLTLLPVLYMRAGLDGEELEGGQRRFGNDLTTYDSVMDSARRHLDTLASDCILGIAPHSLRAVSPDALHEVANEYAGVPIHIHVAEQVREVADVTIALGAPPVAWLMDNTTVGPHWCLIHATHMQPEETIALARSGAIAGLCPITESNLGDGIFDGARFLAEGGVFGIGSDSNVRIALAEELRTLEYSQRLQARARAVLAGGERSTGRTLFDSALTGGARALARDSGRIAVGCLADLVAVRDDALATCGLAGDRLLDGWIFAGDDGVVRDVWSAGRHVVRDGCHVVRDQVERAFRDVLMQFRAAL